MSMFHDHPTRDQKKSLFTTLKSCIFCQPMQACNSGFRLTCNKVRKNSIQEHVSLVQYLTCSICTIQSFREDSGKKKGWQEGQGRHCGTLEMSNQ